MPRQGKPGKGESPDRDPGRGPTDDDDGFNGDREEGHDPEQGEAGREEGARGAETDPDHHDHRGRGEEVQRRSHSDLSVER